MCVWACACRCGFLCTLEPSLVCLLTQDNRITIHLPTAGSTVTLSDKKCQQRGEPMTPCNIQLTVSTLSTGAPALRNTWSSPAPTYIRQHRAVVMHPYQGRSMKRKRCRVLDNTGCRIRRAWNDRPDIVREVGPEGYSLYHRRFTMSFPAGFSPTRKDRRQSSLRASLGVGSFPFRGGVAQ